MVQSIYEFDSESKAAKAQSPFQCADGFLYLFIQKVKLVIFFETLISYSLTG
jgi:hypothetical protein